MVSPCKRPAKAFCLFYRVKKSEAICQAVVGMAEAVKKFRHISDIDVWVTPDRNYFVFILLSLLTGFFALDHIYLRSYDTAFQKLLYNFLGLGIWYWWDVLQIFTEGDKIRTQGLKSPFDWTQGIGRGIFAPADAKKDLPLADKSYIIWTVLALFGGFLALDKFYIGETVQGVLKIFTIPILFGVFWQLWDAYHAVFSTKSVLAGTIPLPFPMTWISDETPGSIFLPGGAKTSGGGISGFAQAIMGVTRNQKDNLRDLVMVPPILSGINNVTDKLDELKEKATPNLPSVPPSVTAAVNSVSAVAGNSPAPLNAGSSKSGAV